MRKWIVLMFFTTALVWATDTKTVEVQGTGTTHDLAIKDGLRNAVEKAVGTLVTSETAVNNSMLIRDNILSYSAGYVEDYKVLSEELTLGQAEVKMSVRVASFKIRQKLDSLNIAVAKLPGQAFSVQIDTKRKAETDASKIILPTLNKYPKAAYKIEIKPPRMLKDNGDNADVKLDYSIAFDPEWLQEFETTAAAIANQKIPAPDPVKIIQGNMNQNHNSIIFAMSPSKIPMSFGNPQVAYQIPGKAYSLVASKMIQPSKLRMLFYSADREVIFNQSVNHNPESKIMQGEDGFTDHPNCLLGTCVGGPMGAWIYKDYSRKYSSVIQVPVNILGQIASVECFFDSEQQQQVEEEQ